MVTFHQQHKGFIVWLIEHLLLQPCSEISPTFQFGERPSLRVMFPRQEVNSLLVIFTWVGFPVLLQVLGEVNLLLFRFILVCFLVD